MKYVIFDLDGTLLDSMAIWDQIDFKFLERYGKTPTAGVRELVKKISLRESAELFKSVFDLAQSVESIIAEITMMGSEEYIRRAQLKPYVAEFLDYLQCNRTKMCIATAAPRQNADLILSRLNIVNYFDFILASEDVRTNKEHPEIYLRCCAKFGTRPSEVTVFEDAIHAVKTAKKAGFRVIGVYDEFSRQDSAQIKTICDRYINHFGEMLEEQGLAKQRPPILSEGRN